MPLPQIHSNVTQAIDVRLRFQWDGVNWTEETANLISANGALETTPANEAYQGGKQVIQQMTIVLANEAGRYSPYNLQSPLYPHIGGGGGYRTKCQVELRVGGNDWESLFVGYTKIPKDQVHTGRTTLTVWDAGEFLRQRRSTTILRDTLEHELVIYYLELAGLVDGFDFISPTYAATYSLEATIAYSGVVVPYSWLDDEPIWDELVDIAQASGARVYLNRNGRVHFEKAWRWASPYTPVVALSVSNYAELDPVYDDKAFYDEFVVSYSPRVPGAPGTELWKLSANKLILPGKSELIEAKFRTPALSVDSPVVNKSYYLRGLDGTDLSGQCSLSVTAYAQMARVTVTNNASKPVILGNVALYGTPLIGQPSEQVKRTAPNPIYNRQLPVRDNPYLVSKLQAESVADTLRWWYGGRKLVITAKGLRGDPTLRLGQAVQVSAPNLAVNAILVKITQAITVTGKDTIRYSQDLTLLEDVFATASGYFVVGQDVLGTAKTLWI